LAAAVAGVIDIALVARMYPVAHDRLTGREVSPDGVLAVLAAVLFAMLTRLAWAIVLTRRRPTSDFGNRSMISTRDLSGLPPVDALRRVMRSLAMLDAILCPDWQGRYFSFNSR
jgi:hypothetical protein